MANKFNLKCGIATAVALAIVSGPQRVRSAEIFEFYTGVRQLGMGGAYTAVVNDETSLLTNPAGLGKLREATFTLADPEISGGLNNTASATASDLSKIWNLNGLRETLNRSKDKHWHTKFQAFPSVVLPNFGIGLHAKYSNDAEARSATNDFRLDYTNDYALVLGYCFRLFSGIVKIGVTGRAVNRVEIHKDIPQSQPDITVENQSSEGTGVAADVGMILTAPVAWLPSLAGVVRDAGNTSYTLKSGMFYNTQTRPQDTKQTIDAGFSVSPILSNRVRMQVTAEYHNVQTASEEKDHMRRFHAGLEFNFADFFFLRGGMNQRYWTTGIELATERFQLQAATYGEEIGTDTRPREDRRWVGKFSLRF